MKFYAGPPSDHFSGEHFYNSSNGRPAGGAGVIQWLANRQPGPWRKWIDSAPGPIPPDRVSGGAMRVTFIGHSSVLIQLDAINILCDPIWSKRASPFSWIGPKRHRAPGIPFEQLPKIDLVLQSHDHYDHFDVPTLRRIAPWKPQFAVPLGVASRLLSKRIATESQIAELDWWQSAQFSEMIRITSVPARHFSGRGLRDRNKTLWSGYVLETPSGDILFAGDTAYGPHFAEIRARFPNLRLALLPIGAYRPQWFMGPVHISPADAVRAHKELGVSTSIGIHFGTFRLADDGEEEPVADLQRALDQEKERLRFWTLEPGEGREIP